MLHLGFEKLIVNDMLAELPCELISHDAVLKARKLFLCQFDWVLGSAIGFEQG